MISLLVTLLILVIIAGVVYYIITLLPIPQLIKNIAYAIGGLILVLYLLALLTGVHMPRLGAL